MNRLIRRSEKYIVGILFASSLAMNFALGQRAVKLQQQVKTLMTPQNIPIGEQVPALVGTALDGRVKTIRFDSGNFQGTLVYVFRPECGWCARNLSNMTALAAQTRDSYQFVAVSTSSRGVDAYVKENKIAVPVLHSIPPEIKRAFGFGLTPETFLISITFSFQCFQ